MPCQESSSETAVANSSGDRLLSVLGLFTIERSQWTVEDAAEALGVSAATSYRYFRRLTNAGLITPVAGAGYTLGPAIIQMDRQIQIADPMLRAARPVMHGLIDQAAEGSALLLCRLFHDRVMCVYQVLGLGPQEPVSYQRGRPMPLFGGATSKIILAHLPGRTLKSLFERNREAIADAGLGADWDSFRAALAAIRRAGHAISYGEIDAGRIGLGIPIFDRDRAVLGSLSFVVSAARCDDKLIARLVPLSIAAARSIERVMNEAPERHAGSARLRVAR